jgi:membrane peptidoglycan carboxypeptidase
MARRRRSTTRTRPPSSRSAGAADRCRSIISPNLIKAVISIEDQRFYDHAGVDLIRIAAAGLHNFEEGRRAEGGSTITQQLARQSFLTPDKTIRRKLKEMLLAGQIEREFSKNEILQLYLNRLYL